MARMPIALVAALLAALLVVAAPATAKVRTAPAGWGDGGQSDEPGDGGDSAGDADDSGDGVGGWPGDDLLPGGADEPGPVLLPPGGSRPIVKGRLAALGSNGVAYAPSKAPRSVKLAIWAANQLRNKPYRWGGGHGRWKDSGYDCSGSVSYALHAAGLLGRPLTSGGFTRYGKPGTGRWISIYANDGHIFMVVAGLRFDTSAMGAGEKGPRWRPFGRRAGGFKVRHPAGL